MPVLWHEMTRALSQGGSARTADMAAVRQAAFCFQEGHEEGLEGGQEDRLLTGQGHAGSDQDGVRCRVQDMPWSHPAARPRLHRDGVRGTARPQDRQADDGRIPEMDGKAHPREEDPGRVVVLRVVAGLIRAPWRDWEKPCRARPAYGRTAECSHLATALGPTRGAPSHAQFVFLWAGKPRPPFRHRCPRARDPPTSYCGCGAVLPRAICQKSAGRTLPAGPQPARPDPNPYRDARHPARRARPKPPYAGRVADIQDDVPASRTPRARCAPQ